MNKPLASCVCVTFDRPHLLNELLYCFLAQDYENKELIIVNDKKDELFYYDDSRVKIYNISERFPSLGAKREFTRALTKGEYIFTMDDDDIYYSNHLSSLINFHEMHGDFDIVMNNTSHYSEWNENVKEVHIGCPLNGACVSENYWKNHRFSSIISRAEDFAFTEKGKVFFIVEGSITYHYRWGLGVWHISGMGGDGIESYGIVTANTPINEPKIIKLIPQISEKVKLYYR
jgi:glycosyltransferase involved in cell wall biosynthesis